MTRWIKAAGVVFLAPACYVGHALIDPEMATSEAAILSRVIDAENGNLSAEAARAILRLGLPATDHARAEVLAARARDAVLTPDEEIELECYRHVARLLELMKSKARRSLRQPGEAA